MDEELDVNFETEGDEPRGHGDAEHKVKKLKDELEMIKKERQEFLDGWQRSKADYVNILKRYEEEKKTERARGMEKAVEQLLPAFDALERAKEHGEIPEGFVAIAKQLETAFTSLEIEAIGEIGERFDPALHEAYGQDAVDDESKDETITTVLEKGYRLGNKIVRPAKVRVGRFE